MVEKYRVNPIFQYQYSDIKEYIGEEYTDSPLRNDELVKILNSQDKRIKDLETELEDYKTLLFRKTVKYMRD